MRAVIGPHQGYGSDGALPATRTVDDPTAPVEAAPPGVARTVGGRYALLHSIGRGGHGEVWAALDALTGAEVAVKLLRDASRGTFSARVRREIAALRLLHVPGVVRLLDEGADAEGAFVVMHRIHGTPFPGCATPCAWEQLVETTVALLETLGRIHAAGVVHRDLKPANVLVDASGRPTVLDFGVALAPLEVHAEIAGEIVGTPAYLAPEQVAREPIGPGTDLYALGVMLFEALTGRTPFESEALTAMVYARVFRPAEPLRSRAPDAPRVACEVVDALLRRHPEARPHSAADVIRMLRGHRGAHGVSGLVRVEPPRLGGDGPVRALVDAALARRSADLVGVTGSGRTRALREAVAALEARGRVCARAARGTSPFSSLEPCLGGLDALHASSLDEVVVAVDARLRGLLEAGAVLVADDADDLDPWSAEALARALSYGALLRAQRAAPAVSAAVTVSLRPLVPADLAPMFLGPERVFHLPSDAARALWSRTGGLAARVAAEVSAWVRAGVARWKGALLAVDRNALNALSLGGLAPRTSTLRASGQSVIPHALREVALAPALVDMLAWVTLAAPAATAALVARASELPAWRVEAALEQLEGAGRVRRTDANTWEPEGAAPIDHLWPTARRRAAHAALADAFGQGTEGRLAHLVCAACLDDPAHDAAADAAFARDLAREATALARRRAAAGTLGPATAALAEALMATRRLGLDADAPEHYALLAAWVEIALAERTPHALDRVHYEICRSPVRPRAFEHLAALVRAALAARSGGDRGLALADAVEPFDDVGLELCRQGVRVLAARRTSLAREEAVVESIAPWVAAQEDPRARDELLEWRARLRYRQSRFIESAALYDAGARDDASPQRRLGALTGAASAWLDALRPDKALERARALRDEAARCRHAYFEAWGEHLLRVTAHRAGVTLAPDPELIELVADVGVKDLEALACLNEAAVAWRAGDLAAAQRYALRGHAIWAASGWAPGAALVRALAVTAGDPAEAPELDALTAWAAQCSLARVAVQILGLLASAFPARRRELRAAAAAAVARIPERDHDARLEVLSVRDALGFLDG